METLAEYVDGLPNLCGQEPLISEAITAGREYPVFPHDADIPHAASTFAVALHMHHVRVTAGWAQCWEQGAGHGTLDGFRGGPASLLFGAQEG